MHFCASNVIQCLTRLSRGEEPDVNGEELALAKTFHSIMLDAQLNKNIEILDEDDLEFVESEEEEEFVMTSDEVRVYDGFSLDYITSVLNWIDSRKNRPSNETIMKRYTRIKAPIYITRFREYYAQNGTRNEKMKKVTSTVFDKFKQARVAGLAIHDVTIKLWAIQASRAVNLEDFRASDSWIARFKRNNKIVSRRVTKFVTKTNLLNHEEVEANATAVIVELGEYKSQNGISDDQVYNADQSGIAYELHTARTLSHQGEKDTIGLVRNTNAKTHSYTVMPFVSMSGNIGEKALICLKETNGEFGPQVQARLFKPDNLYVTCSGSGKMNTAMMRKFITEVYSPSVANHSVLVIDSWTGQKNEDLYKIDGKPIKTFTIPAGATGFMQPLDLYCFRQWKTFIKKFQERALMDQNPIVLHDRNNIIRMNSLVLNQFQSPHFRNMFKYAWSKGGFDVQVDAFQGLNDICFAFNDYICEACKARITFVKCSWPDCRKCLCQKCFFEDYHYHNVAEREEGDSSPENIEWQ
ncbi:uncharacterized protein LOC107360342 [Tetranychus urticae]|uniref:uncharacterized protein LOC107360342 n=1 Tax=Tetranychus urticae TaxID=32264 RepID=UPI00077BE828|nr:uncharacterized protein LOC107360342 [Tetranychus urticae]